MPEALIWLGLVALSGVVGGGAYDLVKAVVQRVASQVAAKINKAAEINSEPDGTTFTEVRAIVNNDDELARFMSMLEEYEGGMLNVDVTVREVIQGKFTVQRRFESETDAEWRELWRKIGNHMDDS